MKKYMSKTYNLLILSGLIILLTVATGCSCPSNSKKACDSKATYSHTKSEPFETKHNTPKNIDLLKQELSVYYESGGYDAGVKRVADAAMKYLLKCKDTPGKLAIVFDIDDTCLSNYKYLIKYNYAYTPETWVKWVKSGGPAVIKPSLDLFNQAKKQGVAIFLSTGEKEGNIRKYYENDLKEAGYSGWTKLIMKPADTNHKLVKNFKAQQRKKITEQGYRIIVNIGDQSSDLVGGYADQTFKYPNPFYFKPQITPQPIIKQTKLVFNHDTTNLNLTEDTEITKFLNR